MIVRVTVSLIVSVFFVSLLFFGTSAPSMGVLAYLAMIPVVVFFAWVFYYLTYERPDEWMRRRNRRMEIVSRARRK